MSKRIGICSTTFARFDMASAAVNQIKKQVTGVNSLNLMFQELKIYQ